MVQITLYALSQFNCNASEQTMVDIWGDAIGQHVWKKFVKNDHQLPLWELGGNDMAKVSEYIKINYPAQPS